MDGACAGRVSGARKRNHSYEGVHLLRVYNYSRPASTDRYAGRCSEACAKCTIRRTGARERVMGVVLQLHYRLLVASRCSVESCVTVDVC